MTTTPQHDFLVYEFSALTIKAALATRDAQAPVYARHASAIQRGAALDAVRKMLVGLEHRYAPAPVSTDDHMTCIADTADRLSEQLADTLHERRLRIGVTQKLINLHLKNLRAAGFIPEPPRCPIDGIIRDRAELTYAWTTSVEMEDYRRAIADLRPKAGTTSLAMWEVQEFRRRRQHG
jgi:hypothetical protein